MKSPESKFEYDPSQNPELVPLEPVVYIVQLTPDDWQVLRDLKIESLDREPIAFEDYESGMARYVIRSEEEWRGWLSNGDRVAVFAKCDEEYVGMVSAVLDREQQSAEIQHMYVAEDQRGKGISKALLSTILDNVKDEGIKKCTLGVLETQTAAINLYRGLGFEEISRVEVMRSGKKYTEILMEKVL